MTVLITGCSSGIGLQSAIYLKQQGYEVIATVRNESDGNRLKSYGIHIVIMDVNDDESITKGVAEALEVAGGEGIGVLINNAGYGQAGALEDISRSQLQAQFETNVFGLQQVCCAIIPHFRARRKGLIINMGSILGLVSLPFRGAYNASKYAVEAMSDTLRMELAKDNIKVVVIEPGPIESKFRETCMTKTVSAIDTQRSHFYSTYEALLATYKTKKKQPFMLSADVVAKLIHKVIEKKNPKPRYQVTIPARVFACLKRILPDRLLLWFLQKSG